LAISRSVFFVAASSSSRVASAAVVFTAFDAVFPSGVVLVGSELGGVAVSAARADANDSGIRNYDSPKQ